MSQTLAMVALVCWMTGRGMAAPAAPLTLAVFDFESKSDGFRDAGPQLAAVVNAHLSASADVLTVERAELDKILSEQELSLGGTVSTDSAAKVGQLTGAKVLVTGRVFPSGQEVLLVTKVIGTETGRVFGQVAKGPKGSALSELAESVSKEIAAVLSAKGSELVAKVVPWEERVQKLVDRCKDVPKKTVSVRLPEQHFGTPVIDPAAQTELILLLQKCGFTVLKDEAAAKAEVQIVGEAFSAMAGRKGNLVCCRARVELKAQSSVVDALIAADRQTSVAVDLAEQTAAKLALQNAALEIAERLLPRLGTVQE